MMQRTSTLWSMGSSIFFFPKFGVRVVLNFDNRPKMYSETHLSQFNAPLTPISRKKVIKNPMDHKVEVLGIILSHI